MTCRKISGFIVFALGLILPGGIMEVVFLSPSPSPLTLLLSFIFVVAFASLAGAISGTLLRTPVEDGEWVTQEIPRQLPEESRA